MQLCEIYNKLRLRRLRWNITIRHQESGITSVVSVDFLSRQSMRADKNVVNEALEVSVGLIVTDSVRALRDLNLTNCLLSVNNNVVDVVG